MSVNIKTSTGLKKINSIIITKQNPVSPKSVNFYDYDGILVNSYTAEEFAQLSAMPINPAHEGLTAQGWNWSLSDAKTYVANYGKLNIGQSYITSDGKTRLYISLHEGRLSPQLGLGINGSVDVDWGDGSEHETMTGSDVNTAVYKEHKYAREGNYIIALTVTGKASIIEPVSYSSYSCLLNKVGGDHNTGRTYLNSLIKIEIGDNVSIARSAFTNCFSLTSITIPNAITSISSSAFQNCYGLGIIDILPISAPTVSNIDAWKGISTDCLVFIPYTSPTSYLTASNYPSPSTYTYLGYNTFANGEELPTISSDENYSYTWYATLDDAKAQTNPISVGIGNKIYCRFAAV